MKDRIRQLIKEKLFFEDEIGDDDILFGAGDKFGFDSIDFLELVNSVCVEFGRPVHMISAVWLKQENLLAPFKSINAIEAWLNGNQESK